MNPSLQIILNGNPLLEFPRNTRLPGKQRDFLDFMDIDMDKGIKLDGSIINSPNDHQRTHYVAMQLIQALKSNNKGLVTATCAYLANRQPTLKQIRAVEEGAAMTLEFVFD